MADLGTDFACAFDLDPQMSEVSGRRALIECIARRLQTPHGGLWYDDDYGYDVRQFLSAPVIASGELASNVEAEAEKDERVSSASCRVSFNGKTLLIKLEIADSAGPFSFVLAVSDVTVEILTQG